MEELVNILTEKGQTTGEIMNKLDAHKNGICHGVSVVAIVDNEGKLLLQKRAKTKKTEPEKWDLSAAGHIDAGESPEEAAIRETFEEVGISISKDELKEITTFRYKLEIDENTILNHFSYLFLVKKDTVDILAIKKQASEVDEIKLVTLNEFQNLLNNNEMVFGAKYCTDIMKYMK